MTERHERKFYILKRYGDDPGYDEATGFVVRCYDEKAARRFAASKAGDEGEQVWLDTLRTSCEELHLNGPVGIVLRSFKAG